MHRDLSPSIAVIMPVHDTGVLLLQSVRSVLDQTLFQRPGCDDWELVVVDDRSTDPDTIAALRTIAGWSDHIRVIESDRTPGPAGTRNAGIYSSTKEWIAFLDSDDLWFPDFLEHQIDCLRESPTARWLAATFYVGDEAAVPIRRPLNERSPRLYQWIRSDYDAGRVTVLPKPVDVLLDCGCLQIMTIQVERAALLELGAFTETLESAEDFELWLRLALRHDLHVTASDAGVYRRHPSSLTQSGRLKRYGEVEMLRRLAAHPDFEPYRRAARRRLADNLLAASYHYRRNGHRADSRVAALNLLRLRPYSASTYKRLLASFVPAKR